MKQKYFTDEQRAEANRRYRVKSYWKRRDKELAYAKERYARQKQLA